MLAVLQEAVVVQQERYTVEQVEALLKRYLYRQEELDLLGPRSLRLLTAPRVQVSPRATVHDAVLERADLFRALARIPAHYRRLLVLWYATDWSTERILHYYRRQYPKLSRATIFRWRQEAVEVLARQMNRNR